MVVTSYANSDACPSTGPVRPGRRRSATFAHATLANIPANRLVNLVSATEPSPFFGGMAGPGGRHAEPPPLHVHLNSTHVDVGSGWAFDGLGGRRLVWALYLRQTVNRWTRPRRAAAAFIANARYRFVYTAIFTQCLGVSPVGTLTTVGRLADAAECCSRQNTSAARTHRLPPAVVQHVRYMHGAKLR